jgi:SM-20-related protein
LKLFDAIADALVEQGYAVVPDFCTADEVQQMAKHVQSLSEDHTLRLAGVGQGAELSTSSGLRGDLVSWVDGDDQSVPYSAYLARLEALKLVLNQSLMLGLNDFEGHYAQYPIGAFYRKHLDQFQFDQLRTLTCIMYLNADWRDEDEGQLRMYLNGEEPEPYLDIVPNGGTLVTFLSSRYWHEVLPATKPRMSLTGWYRRRSALPI